MNNKKFHEFVYEAENIIDELVIVLLSLGAITVSVYTLFFNSTSVDFIQFGNIIDSWIVMVGLMIIGRELWLLNRNISSYLEHKKGER